jgi:hypothetical protein
VECEAGRGDEDVRDKGECEALGCRWDGHVDMLDMDPCELAHMVTSGSPIDSVTARLQQAASDFDDFEDFDDFDRRPTCPVPNYFHQWAHR